MPERFTSFPVAVCGLDELPDFAGTGISHVLSILDPDQPSPEVFAAWGPHRRLELRFHDVIEETAGQIAPAAADVERVLAFGRELTAPGAAVGRLLSHCHAGISRSTAALVMILLQANPARPAEEAVAAVAATRPKTWPNLRMIEIADQRLGRHGELVAAVRRHHREYAAAHPQIMSYLRDNGRRRELFWLDDSAV